MKQKRITAAHPRPELLAGVPRSRHQRLTDIAEDMVRSGTARTQKFEERFKEDPLRAFEWGGSAVEGAAEREVGLMILAWTNGARMNRPDVPTDQVVNEIVSEITDRVIGSSRWPERSTSPLSNLAKQFEAAAFATVLDKMRGRL